MNSPEHVVQIFQQKLIIGSLWKLGTVNNNKFDVRRNNFYHEIILFFVSTCVFLQVSWGMSHCRNFRVRLLLNTLCKISRRNWCVDCSDFFSWMINNKFDVRRNSFPEHKTNNSRATASFFGGTLDFHGARLNSTTVFRCPSKNIVPAMVLVEIWSGKLFLRTSNLCLLTHKIKLEQSV